VTPESVSLPTFEHKSLGMLAYIGADKAIADFPWGARFGGMLTFWFWRSAYLSKYFSFVTVNKN
jgi:NADH:ubiquinone reductase (non-electrogenic)